MRPEKWVRSPRDEEEAKDRALRSPHATVAKEGGMEGRPYEDGSKETTAEGQLSGQGCFEAL